MTNTIQNETNNRHFFQWKEADSKVSVYYGDLLLAEEVGPLMVKEVGKEIYDPVYYFKPESLKLDLFRASNSASTCPIKGEASYLSLETDGELIKDLAWYYPEPIKRSNVLAGRVAFYSNQVKFVIEPNG